MKGLLPYYERQEWCHERLILNLKEWRTIAYSKPKKQMKGATKGLIPTYERHEWFHEVITPKPKGMGHDGLLQTKKKHKKGITKGFFLIYERQE